MKKSALTHVISLDDKLTGKLNRHVAEAVGGSAV